MICLVHLPPAPINILHYFAANPQAYRSQQLRMFGGHLHKSLGKGRRLIVVVKVTIRLIERSRHEMNVEGGHQNLLTDCVMHGQLYVTIGVVH